MFSNSGKLSSLAATQIIEAFLVTDLPSSGGGGPMGFPARFLSSRCGVPGDSNVVSVGFAMVFRLIWDYAIQSKNDPLWSLQVACEYLPHGPLEPPK